MKNFAFILVLLCGCVTKQVKVALPPVPAIQTNARPEIVRAVATAIIQTPTPKTYLLSWQPNPGDAVVVYYHLMTSTNLNAPWTDYALVSSLLTNLIVPDFGTAYFRFSLDV